VDAHLASPLIPPAVNYGNYSSANGGFIHLMELFTGGSPYCVIANYKLVDIVLSIFDPNNQ
jgi:hypothetical protein